MENFLNFRFRTTALSVAFIGVLLAVNDLITGAIIQSGLCIDKDFICIGRVYLYVFGTIITVSIVVDVIINLILSKKKLITFREESKPEVVLMDTKDFHLTTIYATLDLENNTSEELSECYGILEIKSLIPVDEKSVEYGFFSSKPQSFELDMGEKAFIAPKPGSLSLRIYSRSNYFPFNANDPRSGGVDLISFNYRDPTAVLLPNIGMPFGLYIVTIRVNGKKDGKSISLGVFKGYIYLNNIIKSPRETTGINIIRSGNPMKDNEIPLEIRRKLKNWN
jgi:hypothetical protein